MSPILLIILYLALVTVVGVWFTKRNTNSNDWAVAGGGMSLGMIAVGIAGTRIGGAGTYGVAGSVISGGVWYMWWYGICTFLAMAIVGLFFAKPYRRLGLQTVGEIFTIRFGARKNQVLTSLCVQIEYFIVNLIEAYVIAVVLRGLTAGTSYQIDMWLGVIIAAVVLVTYVSLGGLWGTAVTNLIHCSVIIFGLAAVGIMGVRQFGGWAEVTAAVDGHLAAASADTTYYWKFMGGGFGAVLGMFFSAAVHTPAASVYTNYSTAARSEKIIVPGFLLAGVLGGLMPIMAGVVGILTVAKYGVNAGTAGYTNLTKVATDIHPIIGSIAVAAVLAAVISSGGPILLSSATMFVRDWLHFTDSYSPDKKLRTYRIATAIYGVVAALAAWMWDAYTEVSVLELLLFGFAMVVPPAVSVGYLIYWKRTTEAGAFWGMATGLVAGALWFIGIKVAIAQGYSVDETSNAFQRLIHYCFIYTGKGIDPGYATTFVPLIVVPVVSLLTSESEAGKEAFYSRVSRRQTEDATPAA